MGRARKTRWQSAAKQCVWYVVVPRESRNRYVPNISSRWNPLQEAFWFYRAVRAGRMGVDEAIRMIEMTEAQLAWLCKTFPPDTRLFRAIYAQRKRTLEHFTKAYMDNYRLGAMEEAAEREAAAAYKMARSNTAAGPGTAQPE